MGQLVEERLCSIGEYGVALPDERMVYFQGRGSFLSGVPPMEILPFRSRRSEWSSCFVFSNSDTE